MEVILPVITFLLGIAIVVTYYLKNKDEKKLIDSFVVNDEQAKAISKIIDETEDTQKAVETIRDTYHLTTAQAITLYGRLKSK
ncbi:hypothetical protein [Holzapfeliella sp. JNUCC 72]